MASFVLIVCTRICIYFMYIWKIKTSLLNSMRKSAGQYLGNAKRMLESHVINFYTKMK